MANGSFVAEKPWSPLPPRRNHSVRAVPAGEQTLMGHVEGLVLAPTLSPGSPPLGWGQDSTHWTPFAAALLHTCPESSGVAALWVLVT